MTKTIYICSDDVEYIEYVENKVREIDAKAVVVVCKNQKTLFNKIRKIDELYIICDKLQKIVSEIKETKGDLLSYGDRLGTMVQENTQFVDQMVANLRSVHSEIGNQNSLIEDTSASVGKISASVEQLREVLAVQNEGMQNASSAVTQMIGNVGSVSRSIEKMADEFNVLEDDVKNGIVRQHAVNEQIQKIEQQSNMLNDANTVISSIASQTNLLAMNAAIEAAHAGDAGKGFAVVADEIRKLSESSSAQSKSIGEQLKAILGSISSVVEVSELSDKMFSRVSEKIQVTGELVNQIKISMNEQSEGSKQISEALSNMNDAAGHVEEASNQVEDACGGITGDVRNLRASSENVSQSLKSIESGVKVIEEGDESLMKIATSISESIYRITSQIDQFKV